MAFDELRARRSDRGDEERDGRCQLGVLLGERLWFGMVRVHSDEQTQRSRFFLIQVWVLNSWIEWE